MKRRNILIFVAIAGISIGIGASYFNQPSESIPTKCEQIEQQAKQQQSFNGTLTCHPPGVVEVNVSEQIGEKTSLDCVCKKEYNGTVQYFPILSTGNSSSN